VPSAYKLVLEPQNPAKGGIDSSQLGLTQLPIPSRSETEIHKKRGT